jgi:Protein of unknown function (DUF1761)
MMFISIFFTAFVAFFLGFLWYGPVFGNYWIRLKEIPQEHVDAMRKKGMGPMIPKMIGAFVQQVVLSSIVYVILKQLSVQTFAQASVFAILLWFGCIVPTLFTQVLWEDRKIALFLFDSAYYFVLLQTVASMLTWLL